MPSNRLSPARSLQKLRTAFSNSHSPTRQPEPSPLSPFSTTITATTTITTTSTPASPISPSTTSPTPSQSPLTSSSGFPGFAGFSFSAHPSPVFHSPSEFFSFPQPAADSRRVIRRKKSCVELEQEQERFEFDGALVGIVEPRPWVGAALGGIEEVLCGEI